MPPFSLRTALKLEKVPALIPSFHMSLVVPRLDSRDDI